jgi:hypothetical protein
VRHREEGDWNTATFLNHVMQTAQTGSPLESGTIEETISPVALQAIGNWISRH